MTQPAEARLAVERLELLRLLDWKSIEALRYQKADLSAEVERLGQRVRELEAARAYVSQGGHWCQRAETAEARVRELEAERNEARVRVAELEAGNAELRRRIVNQAAFHDLPRVQDVADLHDARTKLAAANARIAELERERASALRAYDDEVVGRRDEVTACHAEMGRLRAALVEVERARDAARNLLGHACALSYAPPWLKAAAKPHLADQPLTKGAAEQAVLSEVLDLMRIGPVWMQENLPTLHGKASELARQWRIDLKRRDR